MNFIFWELFVYSFFDFFVIIIKVSAKISYLMLEQKRMDDRMLALKTLDSSIISFVILVIIFIHSYNRIERIFIQYKLFNAMVILNMALIVIDILGWAFNGLPGSLNYLFNKGFNLTLYTLVPLAPSAWVLYAHYLVSYDENKIKNIRNALFILLLTNAAISVISLYTGWYFSVNEENIYLRGPLFFLHIGYNGLLILYSFIFILLKQNHFQKRQFYAMMLFFVPQIVGTAIQTLHYGVSYNWSGMMISLLIIYFNIQSRNMNTDFLTGTNNRMHLQGYIKARIRNSSEKRTFGAIMVDIDDFKNINDKFGHSVGDEALKDAVQILKASIRRDDFIARFGGDEFIVIIDVQTTNMLEDTIKRIKDNIDTFNEQYSKSYNLQFSLGYDIYDVRTKMKSEDFIAHLDRLMYDDKQNNSKPVAINCTSRAFKDTKQKSL